MTDDQARSQWQKWVQQLEEEGEACELLHDYKGPASAPMRFWVKTSDNILFDEVFEKQKHARVEEKSVKKATQDDIDSMQRKLQTNHENIGRSSVVQDMSVAAKNMLAVKGEDPARSAFEGNNMEIPNITKLAESESEGDSPSMMSTKMMDLVPVHQLGANKKKTKRNRTMCRRTSSRSR